MKAYIYVLVAQDGRFFKGMTGGANFVPWTPEWTTNIADAEQMDGFIVEIRQLSLLENYGCHTNIRPVALVPQRTITAEDDLLMEVLD